MKRLCLIAFLLLGASLYAQGRVGLEDTRSRASEFAAGRLDMERHALKLNDIVSSESTGLPNLFIFDIDTTGFVMVSATGLVMAYSFESPLPEARFRHTLPTGRNCTVTSRIIT